MMSRFLVPNATRLEVDLRTLNLIFKFILLHLAGRDDRADEDN